MKPKNKSKTLAVVTKQNHSHVQKMRVKFASNRATILRVLGLSGLEYELLFLETGCQFLETFYGLNSEWYNRLSKDSKYSFWVWFKTEFKVLENDFVNVLIGASIMPSMADYTDFLNGIPHDQYLEVSLLNFLKRLNGKL